MLEQCNEALRIMKKEAEAAEFWIGKEDTASLKRSRAFIDMLSALTGLCLVSENRIVDLGTKKDEKKSKKGSKGQAEEEEENFEFLNLSEFHEQWDDEDQRVCNEYELLDEQNQRLLRNLRVYEVAIQMIKMKSLKSTENKNSYLKVVERAYIFLIKFVKHNKEN